MPDTDFNDDWKLLDTLLAAIRSHRWPAEEVLHALTTCMAKTIVMAGTDAKHHAHMVKVVGQSLATAVDYQMRVVGKGG
jgi:hypothetical protein